MNNLAPTIHLNGTTADELLGSLEVACNELHKTLEAVARTAPHGRDYPNRTEALTEATAAHIERMNRLRAVYDELQELWLATFVANDAVKK